MLSRSSFTSLVVGVFAVYVAHTCLVMYGIVYTRPCPAAAAGGAGSGSAGCVWPYLARRPKLQVSGAPGAAAAAGGGGRAPLRLLIPRSGARGTGSSVPPELRSCPGGRSGSAGPGLAPPWPALRAGPRWLV